MAGTPPLNDQAQNGIQDDVRGKATITSTTVSGNAYINGVLNGSCHSSSGILAYQDARPHACRTARSPPPTMASSPTRTPGR